MLGHSLPPSEIKSLYGSITRSAVISFSYVTFAMLPPGSLQLCGHPSRPAGLIEMALPVPLAIDRDSTRETGGVMSPFGRSGVTTRQPPHSYEAEQALLGCGRTGSRHRAALRKTINLGMCPFELKDALARGVEEPPDGLSVAQLVEEVDGLLCR